MKNEKEGIIRTHLVTEVPEIDAIAMWKIVRRFGNEAYFFPIRKVKPAVHDALASAVDYDITKNFALGNHMDLYNKDFQEKKLLTLASKVISRLYQYKRNDESIENVFNRLTDNIKIDIDSSANLYINDLGPLEFACRLGEAVSYMHLTNKPYDTEHTYLPAQYELNELSTSHHQLVKLAGYHAAWTTRNSILKNGFTTPSPFLPLIEMRAWGGNNFQFKENDFLYDVEFVHEKSTLETTSLAHLPNQNHKNNIR